MIIAPIIKNIGIVYQNTLNISPKVTRICRTNTNKKITLIVRVMMVGFQMPAMPRVRSRRPTRRRRSMMRERITEVWLSFLMKRRIITKIPRTVKVKM